MAGLSAYLGLMNEHVNALPLKYILPSGTLGTVGCGPSLLLQVATRYGHTTVQLTSSHDKK